MSTPQPDLSEARRLLGAGFRLVKMEPYSKRPEGMEWNKHPVEFIDPDATGYGLILEQNKLCSIDPDNLDPARVGMEALGFSLSDIMAAGVRTRSTRKGSGGRSAFAAEGDLGRLVFASRDPGIGTVIEFRANQPNLQDTIPGIVYRDRDGSLCTQQYSNGKRLDDAPSLPERLYVWWQRCTADVEFYREQQRIFFAAVGQDANYAISSGRGAKVSLAFSAPGHRGAYNRAHCAEELLERHGYTWHGRLKRWSCPTASGAPGIYEVVGKPGLWRSDHASDPLHGAFDAWSAFVVLDHGGSVDQAMRACEAEGLYRVLQPDPPDTEVPPLEAYEDAGTTVRAKEPAPEDPVDDTPLFVTADSLRAQSFEVLPPLIEDMLLVGATLVHGPAKKGKSWLLLQMATTIDAGGDFLGRKCRRADVLYVGAEDTSARFKSRLERMAAWGTAKFMNRDALLLFAKRLQRAVGEGKVTAPLAVEKLWLASGKPSVMFIDTQEVFEVITGIAHGKQGDSITRRDYQATSVYDGIAQKLGIAIVLVGHWGEIKSIEKATTNPHECLNTTKARLAGVLTSITLGPLPNQEPGESTRDMQLSIRSRDIAEGDQFLWVQQSEMTGLYRSLGKVREVLLTDSQNQLFDALIAAHRQHGENHWTTAKDLADLLDCTGQAVKQMVGRVRKSAKAKGRAARAGHYELDSKPSSGYRVRIVKPED